MSRAVCVRCGADRPAFDAVCPACGHRPEGDGLLVAWLLSDAYLDEAGLERAAARIRSGEPVRASDRMLERARIALGRHVSRDAGLSRRARLGLLALGVVATAVPGLMLAWWWREDRPRSARQAFVLSVPSAVLVPVLLLLLWADAL